MVSADHPVRVVDRKIESLDIGLLLARYKLGRTSSYHPRMLLKVLVYSYMSNIYSSRKIEDVLGRDIYFLWLSGMSKPDHNTINRFRSGRLQKILQPIFSLVILLLCDEGLLSLKDLYTDGTKMEVSDMKKQLQLEKFGTVKYNTIAILAILQQWIIMALNI